MSAWRVLQQSVPGTSHEATGLPCQDNCFATTCAIGPERFLIVACSDGAGSAERAAEGSSIATRVAVQEIAKSLQEGWRPNSNEEHSVDRWYESVRKEIESEATSAGVETRQYACTLLIGVVGDRSAVFAQIGDGALVIDSPDGYEVVFWPEPNEYLNITEFVTDERYAEAIHVALLDRRIEECAAFTDGLQLLALNYKERTAHQPFFAPMFERLRVDEEPSELNAPLREFLNSAGVNARTDDDKTLILATRRGHEVV